jgi:hypothetical protein
MNVAVFMQVCGANLVVCQGLILAIFSSKILTPQHPARPYSAVKLQQVLTIAVFHILKFFWYITINKVHSLIKGIPQKNIRLL